MRIQQNATTMELSYGTAPNQFVRADNGVDYAYREIGTSTVPLVLLHLGEALRPRQVIAELLEHPAAGF